MNAATLIAHFERVADAPNATARLKTFILELAVRGKLVPQDVQDGPATKTLHDAGVRAHSSGAFQLPPTWAWINVGAVATARLGKMLDKAKNRGVARPYLRNTNVRWFDFDLSDLSQMPFEEAELEEFALRPGDVLICEGGEPGRAAVWDGRAEGVYFQKAIHRVRFRSFVDPAFFVNALRASAEDGRLMESFTGTGIKHFTGRSLDGYRFPLPPLAEQKRIVAKVDELTALCEQFESARIDREMARDRLAAASLARLNASDSESIEAEGCFALEALSHLTTRPDQLKQVRQTIGNLAVRGQLVPQNSNDGSVADLLRLIGEDKAKRGRSARDRRAINVSTLHGDEVPFPIPSSWVWAPFGDIVISRDGERVPVSRDERDQRDKIYDYYGASGVIDKIDGYLFDKPLLLIGEDGANLINRSSPIAFIAHGEYWVNNHAHVLDGLSLEFLRYVEMFINTTDLKPYVTGSAQPKMNQAKMNLIPVALPPLAEQRRIVAKVDELMALCEKLEASLTSAAATRQRLLNAVLGEALNGPAMVEAA